MKSKAAQISILIWSTLGLSSNFQSEAFTHQMVETSRNSGRIHTRMLTSRDDGLTSHDMYERQETFSNVAVISRPEDYVKFLEEDDRLCVIKFYAAWCKSCAKFGIKYNKLARDYGDRVRFAEVEYNTNKDLCKTLKVRSLPTVHMYKKGKGKIAQMTKRPSDFHDVIDEIDRLLSEEDAEETYTVNHSQIVSDTALFEDIMKDGTEMLKEIMTGMKKSKMKEQEREEKEKIERTEKEKSWFTFPFTF